MDHIQIRACVQGEVTLKGTIHHVDDHTRIAVVTIEDDERCSGCMELSFGSDVDALQVFCDRHNIPVENRKVHKNTVDVDVQQQEVPRGNS